MKHLKGSLLMVFCEQFLRNQEQKQKDCETIAVVQMRDDDHIGSSR